MILICSAVGIDSGEDDTVLSVTVSFFSGEDDTVLSVTVSFCWDWETSVPTSGV